MALLNGCQIRLKSINKWRKIIMTNKDYEIIMGYFNGKHIDREGL